MTLGETIGWALRVLLALILSLLFASVAFWTAKGIGLSVADAHYWRGYAGGFTVAAVMAPWVLGVRRD